ncbi:DHA2 family efflux MFS transporter permease subunit [Effusibacillus dendaii]|uniref:MFS transporter n=1 Tax=Effusibacillus dendaii TaxID=2743772 RepID=A0A7I8DEU8_9BACL|nr:DHA2 family efflux MFS transporter permease subunit [Effusibacillus dendaii]BCJ87812.1 MFS transporter [Effusibacillus dendaii]
MTDSEAVGVQSKPDNENNYWIALIAVILGAFVAILNNSLINVALPKLMSVFGSSQDHIQWVLTGYMLASGIIIPVSGFVGERYGYKKSYLIALSIFVAFSFACAAAWSDNTLIAFRILQGIGGGVIMPLSMSIIYKVVPREQVGMALGLWGVASMVAPAVGPTLSGYLIEYVSWRLLFLMNVPIGLVAILFVFFALKETETNSSLKLDKSGVVLSTLTAGSLLLALSQGQSEGWSSLYIISLFFVAAFSLALLIWVESGKEDPLLEVKLWKNPVFAMSTIGSSLVMIGLYGGIFLTPVYLQNIQGLTPIDTGLLLMPQALAMAAMMPVAGKLFDKVGVVPLGVVGLTILSMMTFELHRLTIDTPNSWLRTVMMIRGIGLGLCMMPLTTAGMNAIAAISPRLIGKASGMGNVVRQVAGSFGIAVMTTIMQNRQALHIVEFGSNISSINAMMAQVQTGLASYITSFGVDAKTASGGALSILIGLAQKEAASRAIAETFLAASLPLFCTIPLVFLMRQKKPKTPPVPASPQNSSTAAN